MIRIQKTLLLLAVFILPLVSIGAEPRGIWWWAGPTHQWGSEQVLADPAKEATILQFMKAWNIGRVYCSISAQTEAKPDQIRSWNQQAHAVGISSQLLLSENSWIYPNARSNFFALRVQRELIDFNAAATNSSQRFDGLHLDIEPQGLPGWKMTSPAEHKQLYELLRDTFRDLRSYMDAHGAKDIPIYADLPVWFDKIGGPIGWTSGSERDAWYADMGRSLAGISLMAYERPTADSIDHGVSWDLKNFKGKVRIGLSVSVGPGKTWNTFSNLVAMIQTQEAVVPSRSVDVHDFVHFYDLARTVPPTAPAKP